MARIGGRVFAQIMIGRDVVAAFAEMFSRGPDAPAQGACVGQSIGHQDREWMREPESSV